MILTKSKNKNIEINSEIDKRIKDGEIPKLLLIVPTNRKVRYLKKEIISSSPNNSVQRINLETISTLSTKIVLNDSDIRRAILSEPASFVLLEQAFKEIDPKYFSNYKNNIPTGTLQQIKNVISEYKRHGITPQILRNEFHKLIGSEKLKAENIADIYEAYQTKLEKIQIKEIGDIYKEIGDLSINEFKKRFKEFYPEVNFIAANGFDEFTQPEINILDLCSKIPGVDLYIHIDYQANNDSIFFHLNNTYLKLIERGFKIIDEKTNVSKNQFENFIRINLFNSKSPKNKIDYSGNIYLLAALNKGKEIEIISKEIKKLIINQQVHPSQICIAFNSIQKYSSIIRDVLSNYGIPFNLTDRFTLSSSQPVISVINILEVLENDFYYKDILRALNSGYLKNLNINSTSILKSAASLKIISGLRNWIDTLKDEIYIRKNNTYNEWDELLKIETFEDALSSLVTIQELLSPFETEMTLKEFKEKVIELIYKLEIPIKLSDDIDFNAEKNIKSLTIFIEVLEELTDLFISEYGSTKKFPLKFYLNYLRTAAKSTRYNVKEKPNYGVQVTSINEIRGLKFEYLFLSGLCDGDFPTRYQPEIFFSGSYFKKENQHQAKERYQFYQALCNWEKKLYLTFPLTDEKRDLVKSNYITELESIVKMSTLNPEEFSNKIYSKEEFLIEIGNKGIDNFPINIKNEEYEFDLEEIESSIKIDKCRKKDPFGNSSFNGFISNDLKNEAREKLADYREKQFSYSQLETYAKCPYKYFAERVLKIEPNEEPTEEMEFHELGTLLHLILYKFYIRLQKEGIVLSGCSNE
ncbi:MAG: exodeoxyribonuclease V subunit gamma, partial [Bacteroidetes bacterium]|nr:exodeoxyribonuclease V subunit gamma [Bacteroidota bacterium]